MISYAFLDGISAGVALRNPSIIPPAIARLLLGFPSQMHEEISAAFQNQQKFSFEKRIFSKRMKRNS